MPEETLRRASNEEVVSGAVSAALKEVVGERALLKSNALNQSRRSYTQFRNGVAKCRVPPAELVQLSQPSQSSSRSGRQDPAALTERP